MKFFKRIFSHKIVQNFSYLAIGSLSSQFLGLIALIKIARVVTPTDYGLYTFLLTQGQLLITIGDLGLRYIIIRRISRDKNTARELLFTGAIIKIIAVFLLAGAYIIYNSFWGSLTYGQLLLVFMFATFNCLSNLFDSIFWGNEKMLTPSIINVGESLIWLIIIFSVPLNVISVTFLFFLYLGMMMGQSATLYHYLVKQNLLLGYTKNFFISAKSLLKESWPYFSLVIIMLPVNYFSNNFLDINSTKIEIGYFNLSQKIMSPITMTLSFFVGAIFPNISALWVNDKEKFYRLISLGIKYWILGAVALCFLFTLFSKEIIIILFSNKYFGAIKVSQLQIWYVFLMGINSLIGTIWGAMDKEKLILHTAIINALISVPLLYIGSYYGAIGISSGYVTSFAIFEIYLWTKFRKTANIKMKEDLLLWVVAIVLFLISFLILAQYSALIRIISAIIIIFGVIIYLIRTYEPIAEIG